MSDVMKAIREADEAVRKFENFHYIDGWERPQLDKYPVTDAAYPILRDHIGALHSAIARLQGEYERNDMFSVATELAFTDLFELLPTDWAGEGQ